MILDIRTAAKQSSQQLCLKPDSLFQNKSTKCEIHNMANKIADCSKWLTHMAQVHNSVGNANSGEDSEKPSSCSWIWFAETIQQTKGEEWEDILHVIAMGTVMKWRECQLQIYVSHIGYC